MSTNSKIKLNLDSLKARREWKRHKVKDGHNVFRILPPFGPTADGYVYRKWQIIWGLKNPEDGRMRPYASSMTTEKRCPVTEYVVELKAKAEKMKAQYQAKGLSEDIIKERLASIGKMINDLSPKTVYIYNAVDKAGDVGLLELKSTAHKKMKTELMQYVNDYGQDPTSLNSAENDSGLWFDVIRAGLGRDTTYDVKKCQTKVRNPDTGKIAFEDDRSPTTDNVVDNYHSQLGYDLSSVYQVKSYDELNEIFQANLAEIYEVCPDADLDAEAGAESTQKAATPFKSSPVVTIKPAAKKVDLKFDDSDDEEESTPPSRAPTAMKASSVDDDFMAEADALLNS